MTGIMHDGRSLTDDIRMWRTPTDDSGRGGPTDPAGRLAGRHTLNLQDQVCGWPTPDSRATAWPTPTARDHKDGAYHAGQDVPPNCLLGRVATLWATPNGGRVLDDETVATKGTQEDGTKRQVDLGSQVRLWATPRAEDSEQCGNHPGANDSLTGQTRLWQTPQTDSFRSRSGDRKDEQGLDQQTRLWKTPHGIANTDRFGKTGGGGGEFHKQAMAWPTPTAEPYGSSQNGINGKGGTYERPSANTPSLERLSHSFLPPPATPTLGDDSLLSAPTLRPPSPSPTKIDSGSPTRLPRAARPPRLLKPKLNPQFVEWLMGLPIGWTGSGRAGIPLCLWRARMRFALSRLAPG